MANGLTALLKSLLSPTSTATDDMEETIVPGTSPLMNPPTIDNTTEAVDKVPVLFPTEPQSSPVATQLISPKNKLSTEDTASPEKLTEIEPPAIEVNKEPNIEQQKPIDNELANAQQERDRLLQLVALGRGGQQIGAAISGTKADPTYLEPLLALAGTKTRDVIEKKEQLTKDLQRDILSNKAKQEQVEANIQTQFAKEKNDSASPMSEIYRSTLRDFTVQAGMPLKVDEKKFNSLSAAALERLYPNIVNLVNTKLAREGKLEVAREIAKSKQEREADKKEGQNFLQETKLRNEITAADDKINFSQTKYGYENLKNAMAQGRWGGIEDVAAIYSFIKALDPGSVVRESETELILSAQSPLAKYGNQFRRITRGDLASPQFRKKLLDSFGHLYEERKKQFDFRVKPKLDAAKNYGLNTQNIVDEYVPGYSKEVAEHEKNSQEVERTTKDGKTAIFDAKTRKFIRYKE